MADSSCGDSRIRGEAAPSVDDMVCAAREAAHAAPPVAAAPYAVFGERLRVGLRERWPDILKASASDVDRARALGHPSALLERVELRDSHLDQLTALVDEVLAALPRLTEPRADDPGEVDGMSVRRVPRPLGVILFVYEARPTVTIEGALMAVATGNAVLLRGGKEIGAVNEEFRALLHDCLAAAGLPTGMVHVLDDADRSQLRALLKRRDAADLLIPRGSPSLIDYCQQASKIPVLASGGGVNHLYVHSSADLEQAAAIALDSKLSEPTACNTLEMVLVDSAAAAEFVSALVRQGERQGVDCTLRLPETLAVKSADHVTVEPLAEHDLGREFPDRSIAVSAVDCLDGAVAHIRAYGTGHTEAVAADDPEIVDQFCRAVDAAAIVVNGSTRLHDGPTMRLGPEISISTNRLHARGPVGLPALFTYSWIVDGRGRLRDVSDPRLAAGDS
ncbi:MAG: glutamate-5-semialdehyde dehydrogenase [Stackebrandtia sp.]